MQQQTGIEDIYKPAKRTTFPPTLSTSSSAFNSKSVRGLLPFATRGDISSQTLLSLTSYTALLDVNNSEPSPFHL
jgi:hypothetical protein